MKAGTNILNKYKGADFNISPEAAHVLRNAYLLLAGTMVPTVLGVFLGMIFPIFSYLNPWLALALFLAGGIYSIFAIHQHQNSMTGIYWLLFLTFTMGYLTGPVISQYMGVENGPEIIIMALSGTAGLFFGLSVLGRCAKYNLSGPTLGMFLLVGLFLMIILSLANLIFFQLSALALLVSFGVMGICSLLIMYETNAVVRGGESNYVVVTLGFYLSLSNIFLSLLQILTYFSGNRN